MQARTLAGSVLLCGFLCAFAPWREPDRLQKEVSRKDAETQSSAKSKWDATRLRSSPCGICFTLRLIASLHHESFARSHACVLSRLHAHSDQMIFAVAFVGGRIVTKDILLCEVG